MKELLVRSCPGNCSQQFFLLIEPKLEVAYLSPCGAQNVRVREKLTSKMDLMTWQMPYGDTKYVGN